MKHNFKIKNSIGAFYWFFTLFFCSIGGIFYYLLLTQDLPDKTFDQTMKWFFLLGIPFVLSYLTITSLHKALLTVTFDNQTRTVTILKRFIHKKECRQYHFNEMSQLGIDTTKDSDGDDYFTLYLTLTDGNKIHLKEGHSREYLENLLQKCLEYLQNKS